MVLVGPKLPKFILYSLYDSKGCAGSLLYTNKTYLTLLFQYSTLALTQGVSPGPWTPLISACNREHQFLPLKIQGYILSIKGGGGVMADEENLKNEYLGEKGERGKEKKEKLHQKREKRP